MLIIVIVIKTKVNTLFKKYNYANNNIAAIAVSGLVEEADSS